MGSSWTGPSGLPVATAALLMLLQGASGFTVCVIPFAASSFCQLNTSAPTSFYGFDVDLFRCVVQENYNTMMARLTVNNTFNNCAAYMGGITITSARLSMGVQFSQSYWHTGLGIMYYSGTVTYDRWTFIRPFHWSLWLAFLLTIALVPTIVWFVERLNVEGYIPLTVSSCKELKFATYKTTLSVYNLDTYPVITLPSQLLMISFCFTVLIVVSNYTANLAALITVDNASGDITSVKDLRGQPVEVYSTYVDRMKQRYMAGAFMSPGYTNLDDWMAYAQQELAEGTILAVANDYPHMVEYIMAHNTPDCNYKLLNEVALPFDYGFAFHDLFPENLITHEFNIALTAAQETGIRDRLQDQYYSQGDSCSVLSTGTGLKFQQLQGLWIIMGCTGGLAVLWSIVTILLRVRQHMKEQHKDKEGGSPGSFVPSSNHSYKGGPPVSTDDDPLGGPHCSPNLHCQVTVSNGESEEAAGYRLAPTMFTRSGRIKPSVATAIIEAMSKIFVTSATLKKTQSMHSTMSVADSVDVGMAVGHTPFGSAKPPSVADLMHLHVQESGRSSHRLPSSWSRKLQTATSMSPSNTMVRQKSGQGISSTNKPTEHQFNDAGRSSGRSYAPPYYQQRSLNRSLPHSSSAGSNGWMNNTAAPLSFDEAVAAEMEGLQHLARHPSQGRRAAARAARAEATHAGSPPLSPTRLTDPGWSTSTSAGVAVAGHNRSLSANSLGEPSTSLPDPVLGARAGDRPNSRGHPQGSGAMAVPSAAAAAAAPAPATVHVEMMQFMPTGPLSRITSGMSLASDVVGLDSNS